MPSTVRSDRSSQIIGWAVLSLFLAGIFLSVVGAWTGPITGVWFVGTQKPRRGFLWLLAFSFLPGFFAHWRKFPHDGPEHAILYLALALLTAVLAILPLAFHRLVSPHLEGFFSTLPFPLATVAIPALAVALHAGVVPQAGPKTVLIAWFAATLVWMWNSESRATAAFLGASVVLATALELIARFTGVTLLAAFPNRTIAGYACLGGALFLTIWALFHPIRERNWADRREALARLQSPLTRESLQVAGCPRSPSFGDLGYLNRQSRRAFVLAFAFRQSPHKNGCPRSVCSDLGQRSRHPAKNKSQSVEKTLRTITCFYAIVKISKTNGPIPSRTRADLFPPLLCR